MTISEATSEIENAKNIDLIEQYKAQSINDREIVLAFLNPSGDGRIDVNDAILLLKKANIAKTSNDIAEFNYYSRLADLAQKYSSGKLKDNDVVSALIEISKIIKN